MRSLALTCFIAGLWVCAARLAHSASNTIDIASVRPGMKGYGLTVFRGTKPERFDVEVIDVLHQFMPDQDLILIRTLHPVLEKAIVVGGMSGSPIYLEGKLAGAYAYGWPFGKEPVAGVTPIANMLAELSRPVDRRIWKAIGASPQGLGESPRRPAIHRSAHGPAPRAHAARLAGLPPYLGQTRIDAFDAVRSYARANLPDADSAQAALRPAVTPLMLSGIDGSVARLLDGELSGLGLVGLQSGSAGRSRSAAPGDPPPRYEDGGSLGIQLMRGDIDATAIGTVTHVVGPRAVAFGHPMINGGQSGLPTCTARVLHVLANERRSFKLGEAIAPLGALVHDRQSAVVVDTTVEPDVVPLALRLQGLPAAQRSKWNVELASHRLLTPVFAFSALASALSASAADQTDVTYRATSRVQVQGYGTIETRDVGYSSGGAASATALGQLRLFQVLDATYGNPFESARVERIEVDLELRFERDVITILDALVPSTEVDPGSDVPVYVTLRPFGQPEQVRKLAVHIPRSAAGQKIEIGFEGGNRVQIERPEPDDLAQIYANIRTSYPATSLIISTKLPNQGLSLRGQVVRGLPASALDTLQLSSDAARVVSFATQLRSELPIGHIVEGSAKVSLDVRTKPLR